jgi:drug/metabolite transporter (DMT)-like permease
LQQTILFFAVIGCGRKCALEQTLRASAMNITGIAESSGRVWRSNFIDAQSALVFGAAGLAVLLFALVPSTTRIAASELSGLSIGLIRAVGAGVFALSLLLILRKRLPRRADWGLLALYAVGNFAGFPILFAIGVRHTSGSHAALIMAAMPLIIAFIGMVLEGRLPRWIWFAGSAIAVGGETALVGFAGMSHAAGASTVGDTVVLAACVLSAVGIVAGARLGSRIGPLSATLWASAIAGVSLAPWAAVRLLTMPYAYGSITAAVWWSVFQITLGAAVLANLLWLWAVSRGGLVRIAPIQFAQPVCALFLASALLSEPLTTSLLLISVSIVLGTVIACRGARSKQAAQAPQQAAAQSQSGDERVLAAMLEDSIRALMEIAQAAAHPTPPSPDGQRPATHLDPALADAA